MLPAHSGSVSRSPPGTQWALVPGTALTLSSAGPSAAGNHGLWRGRLPGVTHHESPQKHKEPPKRDPEHWKASSGARVGWRQVSGRALPGAQAAGARFQWTERDKVDPELG